MAWKTQFLDKHRNIIIFRFFFLFVANPKTKCLSSILGHVASAICSIISSKLSLLHRIKRYFNFDSSIRLITLVLTTLYLLFCCLEYLLETDLSQASVSLFSKLQWIFLFDLIKYSEVVLPNASKKISTTLRFTWTSGPSYKRLSL